MPDKRIVAVTGSGAIGWHPLDRRTWSGASHAFFSRLQDRGYLERAFGVEASRPRKWYLMGRNFHPNRQRWRKQFYMDVAYREALTAAVRRNLRSSDLAHDIVQVGAMFNSHVAAGGRTRCFTFMDSNVAVSLRSPYAPKGLPSWRIDRILEYERTVYNDLALIFTAGEYLKDSLIRDFGVPAHRIAVIGLGMTLPAIPEIPAAKNYDSKEILFLGAHFTRKGGETLLRAFKAARERVPGARLHIVGPRSLRIPPELAAGVEYHGHLLKTDAAQWARLEGIFHRCSLFVLPSLYEPFGMAPLEAMAYQIPCVVTNIQSLREFVIPGETGALVEPARIDELADALAALLSDPEGLARMGRTGRERVLERFTWDAIVDKFLKTVTSGRTSG